MQVAAFICKVIIPQDATNFLGSGLAERLREGERRRSRLRLRLAFFALALQTIKSEIKFDSNHGNMDVLYKLWLNVMGKRREATNR